MLIKSNIKIPKRASKFVAVLNNVTFIFYGLKEKVEEKVGTIMEI